MQPANSKLTIEVKPARNFPLCVELGPVACSFATLLAELQPPEAPVGCGIAPIC
jgi:hypothetical protein